MADNEDEFRIDALLSAPCATFTPPPGRNPAGARAASLKGTRWDLGGTIKIRFFDGDDRLHGMVEETAKIWADLSNLKFQYFGPRDTVASDIRIGFTGAVGVQPNEYSSLIGTQARTVNQFTPTMKLGFTQQILAGDPREWRRLILHEFGHLMGLIHEHQNPNIHINFNRPALLQFFSRLGWTPEMVDQNIIQRFDPSQVQATAPDFNSIMLYAFPRPLADPPTHQNYELSDLDKKLIREIYEVGGAGTPTPAAADSFGAPLDLGTPSDEQIYIPINPLYFRFRVDTQGAYVAQTVSQQPMIMELLGPNDHTRSIAVDDKFSGPGPNAEIRRDLDPGTYFLKVSGRLSEVNSLFRVRVDKG